MAALFPKPTPDAAFRRFRRRGDTAALSAVFDAVAPELMRVARAFARGDEALAEDAVQSAFLAAMEKAEHFDEGRRVMPWLLGLLSIELRRLRADARRLPDPGRLLEDIERRSPDSPDAAAVQSELRAIVAAKVEELPDTYRDAVRTHLFSGTPAAHHAAQVGLSPGALHVRIHRGLGLLRASLPAGVAFGAGLVTAEPRGLAPLRAAILGGHVPRALPLPAVFARGGIHVTGQAVLGSLAVAGLAVGGGVWAHFAAERSADGATSTSLEMVETEAAERSQQRNEPLPSDPLRTEVVTAPTPVVSEPTVDSAAIDDELEFSQWLALYRAASGYSQVFSAGARLIELPAARGARLARRIYPLLDVEQRKQFAKPFIFNEGASYGLEVVDWVAGDEDAEVRAYAWTFLQPYALTDFAADPDAYRDWRRETEGLERRAVLLHSGKRFQERCRVTSPAELDLALEQVTPPTARMLAALGLDAHEVCPSTNLCDAVLRLASSSTHAEIRTALHWLPFAGLDPATARATLLPLLVSSERTVALGAAHALARSGHSFAPAELERVFGAEAQPTAAEAQSSSYWIKWTARAD